MTVECDLQAFFTASLDDFLPGHRKLGVDDVNVYVFPPGNCYFLGIRENLIVEIPEETFDHLVSTGSIFLCLDEPESYLLQNALAVRLPKEKLIEARGAYAAHRSTLGDLRGPPQLSP
jgi:hypothetical protein